MIDSLRTRNGPKAIATHLLLPLAYGPQRGALRSADRFLRINPRAPAAKAVYRRALTLAREMPLSDEAPTLARAIILKASEKGSGERGLLLVSFESELAKLARSERLRDITASYDVAFLASWHPFYSLAVYQYAARATRPLLMMPSSRSDYELCRSRHTDMVALPFQASSWVNAEFFPPGTQKDIDIIMVANFSAYKRHWQLFRALRDLPQQLRVMVVGVPLNGRTRETLLGEASLFGTAHRFEIYEPSPNEVPGLLSRAKVFLGLSAKEGSYIAVAEALFAGTPVAVYRRAMIGSKDYVNEQTGVLLDERRPLGPQIESFLERAGSFSPARWARANISSTVNGERLNDLLRARALEHGEPWTRDIAPFFCRYFDFYYHRAADEDAFTPVYDHFRHDYGITIARPGHPGTRV